MQAGEAIGRFVVTRTIGEGGMGTVVEATDPELGRQVALKLRVHAHEQGARGRLAQVVPRPGAGAPARRDARLHRPARSDRRGQDRLVPELPAGFLFERSYDPAHDTWTPVLSVRGDNGLPLPPIHPDASPAIVTAPFSPADGLWRSAEALLVDGNGDPTLDTPDLIGRPALAWVEDSEIQGVDGQAVEPRVQAVS